MSSSPNVSTPVTQPEETLASNRRDAGSNPAGRATPGNESYEHFILKQIALPWLKKMGAQFIDTEVEVGGLCKGGVTRADAVGIQQGLTGPLKNRQPYSTVRVVEVKVSKADFQRGFCMGGHLNYLMTPKGLLSPDELPAKVGLIEVDFDAFRFRNMERLQGLEVVRRPRRMKVDRRRNRFGETWEMRLVQQMVRKHSNSRVYRNPWLEAYAPGYARLMLTRSTEAA